MAGKFCSTRSWAKAMQRCTDFTNITTCEGGGGSQGQNPSQRLRAPGQATGVRKRHLVKLQHIQEVKELAVLLTVLKLDVVLLQPMQRELGFVVHKHLHGLCRKERRKGQAGLTSGHPACRELSRSDSFAAMLPESLLYPSKYSSLSSCI